MVDPKAPKKCDEQRLRVGLNYAKQLGASHAILTGRANPTQEDSEYLCQLCSVSREYLPLVDIHTNGILFQTGKKHQHLLPRLAKAGLTMVTISIASFDSTVNNRLMRVEQDAISLIKQARHANLLVRCSLVVNKQGVADFDGVMNYIRRAGQLGAQMVVVREVWVPEVYGVYNQEVYRWNLKNKISIMTIQDEFKRQAKKGNRLGLRQLNPLPWGHASICSRRRI